MEVQKNRALNGKPLHRLKSLAWLAPEQLDRLTANMTVVKVRRRDAIFFEGELSDQVYILLSGVAKLSLMGPRSERALVGLVAPGEVFGVSSLLRQQKRPFRCEAFGECTVGVIRPELFVGTILGVQLADLSQTLDVTVGRWWGMLLRYASFQGYDLRERLVAALLELSAKFGVQDDRGMILTLVLTHADLAELIGASRQRITEQLNDLERRGAIIRDGRRLILVTQKLSELAEAQRNDSEAPPVSSTETNGKHKRDATK